MIKINNGDGMSTYISQPNQSIFDIAVAVHGSIDGIADILINNTDINMVDEIKSGTEILFTSIITLDKPTVDFLDNRDIIPSNKGIDILFKEHPKPVLADIFYSQYDSEFIIKKTSGNIYVDWGDNSEIEYFSSSDNIMYHQFDISRVDINEKSVIRIFADSSENIGDLTVLSPYINKIIMYRPIAMNSYIDASEIENPTFLLLAKGIKKIHINNSTSLDFGFLGTIETLKELEVKTKNTTSEAIDKLFISIVNNYGSRLPASIKTKVSPNGVYKKPKDASSPQTGMEAVWILINSELWNTETHRWKIEIDGIEYEKVTKE